MGNINELKFWTYKILPLVYDDSLSYYEVVDKVSAKLNEVIKTTNQIPESISSEIEKQLKGDGDVYKNLFSGILNAIATNENDGTYTPNVKQGGEIIWLNGTLYEVVQPMAVGVNYVVGSNIAPLSIDSLYKKVIDTISAHNEYWHERAESKHDTYTYVWWKGQLYRVDTDIAVNDILSERTIANGITSGQLTNVNIMDEVTAHYLEMHEVDNNLQTQIDDNDGDIKNLQNTDTNLQNQITTNNTSVNNRIDNIVAQSGTDNTEIVDARMGSNLVGGQIYTALGKAIRDQIEYIGTKLNTSGSGNIAFKTFPNQYIVKSDGTMARYNGWSASDYIPVKPGMRIVIPFPEEVANNGLYNSNKEFIISTKFGGDSGTEWVIPTADIYANVAYIRISNTTEIMNNIAISVYDNIDRDLNKRGYYADSKAVGDALNEKANIINLNTSGSGNIAFKTFPNQYIVKSDGTMAHYNGWSASDYIPVKPGMRIVIPFPEEVANIGLYKSNKEFIISTKFGGNSGTEWVMPTTDVYANVAYIRISNTTEIMNNIAISVYDNIDRDLNKRGYYADSKAVGDALDSLKPVELPNYYQNYLQSKIETLKTYDSGLNNGDRFIFFSDYHMGYHENKWTPYLFSKIAEEIPINYVFSAGDNVNASDTQSQMKSLIMSFLNRFIDSNLYSCTGNHEYYSDWLNEGDYKGGITSGTLYTYLNSKKIEQNYNITSTNKDSGFALENRIQKIVYLFIGNDYYLKTNTQTLEWLFSYLENNFNSEIGVIVTHYALNVTASGMSIGNHFNDIKNGIEAFNNKSEQFTFNNKDYNFSKATGKIILILNGHTHRDGHEIINGINYVSITTDNYYLGNKEGATRQQNTITEGAFDVVTINKTNKKIYLTRIGYGNDLELSYE